MPWEAPASIFCWSPDSFTFLPKLSCRWKEFGNLWPAGKKDTVLYFLCCIYFSFFFLKTHEQILDWFCTYWYSGTISPHFLTQKLDKDCSLQLPDTLVDFTFEGQSGDMKRHDVLHPRGQKELLLLTLFTSVSPLLFTCHSIVKKMALDVNDLYM